VIPLTIQDQFHTIQNLERSPIPQTSNWSSLNWSGTFFAVFLQQTGSNRNSFFFNNKMKKNTRSLSIWGDTNAAADHDGDLKLTLVPNSTKRLRSKFNFYVAI
jgi:hypothetical protein